MRTWLLWILPLPMLAQPAKAPNYDNDVKPIFARHCFGCHNASQSTAGLSLESYAGVLKGGGSGEIVKPGRPSASILYQAVVQEGSAPRMPLGQARIPDSEIAVIRDWIQQGLLENASSQPKGAGASNLDFHPSNLNRPAGAPAMPQALPALNAPEPARLNPVTALAASPWAPLLAVSGHDRIYLHDLQRRTPIGVLPFPEGIPFVLRFSRDGSTLLAGGGRGVQTGKVALYDVRTGRRTAVLGDERDVVLAADISADGKLVALGSPSKVVKVYRVADGKLAYQITRHTDWITALEFSPDGSRLATADRTGGIYLWDSATGQIIVSLAEHKDSVTALSWRTDSKLLASGSEDGQLILWDATEGWPVATAAKAHTPKPAAKVYGTIPGGVLSLQFLADGRLVSTGRDRTIRLWSSEGKQQWASATFDEMLTKVAASYDGKLLVAGDYEGRVFLWDGKATVKIALQR
jgi:WD40 repeat protein